MLRWSLLLFVLSLVEETLGRHHPMEGSSAVAKISFVLAISLLILFHRVQAQAGTGQRKNAKAA